MGESDDEDSDDEDDESAEEEEEATPKKVSNLCSFSLCMFCSCLLVNNCLNMLLSLQSANGKKRLAESGSKTPVPEKKAKLVTPAGQKTGLFFLVQHNSIFHLVAYCCL